MKTLLFAEGDVGLEITKHMITYFPQDLIAVFVTDENAISEAARAANIPYRIFRSSDEDATYIRENGYDPELGILAWWPRLIKQPLLGLPTLGFLNTHPSFLPYNRGKHYNFWTLVEQSPFGVSLHFVDEGIDTGDTVAQQKIEYDWEDDGESLYFKAQQSLKQLFIDTYPLVRVGNVVRKAQDLSTGSFHKSNEIESASKIDLDSSMQVRRLLNQLRARTFAGKPACWFEDNGQTYEVRIDITRREK